MHKHPLRLSLLGFSALLLCACNESEGEVSTESVAMGATTQAERMMQAAADCPPLATPAVFSGSVPTPQSVLRFDLGSREVTNQEANQYLDALAAKASPALKTGAMVVTGVAATSVEGRPVKYAIVGDKAYLTTAGLARLRQTARQLMDPDTTPTEAEALAASMPAIFWISANVHGDEESGADAALRVLYELADRTDCAARRIRDNAVVVILPIQNPDGREADTRRNAYGFDMNRDWFARTQPETDGKLELLRQYPPQLFVDAHETSLNHYFFPPTADPIYHEVPAVVAKNRDYNWINSLYSPAIATEFERLKIPYFHGAPYDLYAIEYGDSVTTVGFHAAGMTFEKYSGASIATRTLEHYVAMWSALSAGASNRQRILTDWHATQVEARDQGLDGRLEPNGIYYDAKSLYQPVPDAPKVRHYFLRNDDPEHARAVARLVRRLQRMDVKVWQLQAPLTVADFRAYGQATASVTLPRGSYWIPMAQTRKHWIQAMLHHDPYSPVGISYDVSAWSNPLLMNVAGGSSGLALTPAASLAAPVAEPAPLGAPDGAPRVGLFEIPGGTGFESGGSIRHLFERVWGMSYTKIGAAQIQNPEAPNGLNSIDVLLVPDGYANNGLQALGAKGQKALLRWVENGGRYVGYLGGTELAIGAGVSTVVLKPSHTAAPGTLIRIVSSASQQAAAWAMYHDDALMSPGLGQALLSFPTALDKATDTSGLAEGVEELAGSAAVIDEPVGLGRSVVFAFDPNFRGWTEGTQALLRDALAGDMALGVAAADSSVTRAAAVDNAKRALKALPDTGKAIRIVVKPADADITRALLQRYGAEFRELSKSGRTVFLIANREGLSREEHPYAQQLARELSQLIAPISFSAP